jgi:hypothetical protein
LIGAGGLTIVSGSNINTLSSRISNALVGVGNVTVISGANTTIISGSVGTISGSVGIFSSSLTVSGIPVTLNGLKNIVEDTTPQLGGNLDAQNFDITGVKDLRASTGYFQSGPFVAPAVTISSSSQTALRVKGGVILLENSQSLAGEDFPSGQLSPLIWRSFDNGTAVGSPSSLQALRLYGGALSGTEFWSGFGPDLQATLDINGKFSSATVSGEQGQFGGTVRANTGNFINLSGMREPLGFGWTSTATGTLVLEQYALYPYTIKTLRGQTENGTVSGTLRVNNAIVGGINDKTWSTIASIKTATSNNSVSIGDRVKFLVSGTSNGAYVGFTLETLRL